MRVALTGASGLVGRALAASLRADGHEVRTLVRRAGPTGADEVAWDPAAGTIDAPSLEGLDALVHLAGESVAERWTDAQKRRIEESRVRGTTLVATTLAALARPPRVLVSASAVGYYGGVHGGEPLDESAPPGDDFLARVCVAWEASAEPARAAGIRVVHPRLGVVLAREGGMLEKLRLPFSLGAGGRIGAGTQWMSWVAIEDVVAAVRRALDDDALRGPLNVVAPEAVTNADFTKALARALHRPAVLPLPSFALKLALGEMADAMLLGGQNAVPRALVAHGFSFAYPTLDAALAHVFAK